MKKRSFISEILFYAVVLGLIIFVLSTLFSGGAEQVKEDYATIDSYFRHGQVVKVFITQEHELVLDVVIDGVGQQKIYQIADIDNFHAFFDELVHLRLLDNHYLLNQQ